jgi:hypothetical protein
MIIKEVKFTKTDKNGKESQVSVMLGYCFATEIAFKEMSGEDVGKFVREAVKDLGNNVNPDRQKSIYLIMAAVEAYYESIGKKAPITEKDLMNSHQSGEFGTALGTILGMHIKMNTPPKGDDEDKKDDSQDEEEPKNA